MKWQVHSITLALNLSFEIMWTIIFDNDNDNDYDNDNDCNNDNYNDNDNDYTNYNFKNHMGWPYTCLIVSCVME